MKIQSLWLCAVGVLGTAAAPAVFAAEPLAEVIVTATRQGQALREYAGSVSRISVDEVGLVGSTHHSEILNRAAGTMIQRNSGQESLTAIRSPVLSGPGSCGSFLFLEDSVPIRPVGFCNVNELFEVNTEQAGAIEILRGPAGVVYGSSAMHGAVNVLQPAPRDLPRHSFGFEFGPDEYYRGRFGFSRTGDTVDFSAQGIVTDDGGWRADAPLREQKLNMALASERGDSKFDLRLSATNLNQETAGFIQGKDAYRDRSIAKSNFNPEAYRDAYAVRLVGHYQRPVGDDLQLDIRPYVRTSRMDFRQHFLIGKPLEENGQDSLGVLTAVHGWLGDTSLTAGLDLEVADSFLRQVQEGPATDGPSEVANAIRPAGKQYDYEVRSIVAAVYGLAERMLSERWKLSGGVRVEHVEYDYDNRMIAGNTDENGIPCPFSGCLYSRPADRTDTFTNVTPKLGLTFLANDHLAMYASVARGYRAPDTSELYRLQRQQSIAELDSERLDSVELGMRGDIGDRFKYAIAAFDMRKDNVIFRDANAFNVSDGRTKHRGLEYELSWMALENLLLSAAGTYAKHEYDFDREIEGGEVIVAGREVDTAPRHIHTARASWRFLPAATAELELMSVGSYYLDASNQHEYEGHNLLNLRVGWDVSPSWGVTLRLNNVTDRVYADRADFAFGNYRYFPGRDRTLFVELRYTGI